MAQVKHYESESHQFKTEDSNKTNHNASKWQFLVRKLVRLSSLHYKDEKKNTNRRNVPYHSLFIFRFRFFKTIKRFFSFQSHSLIHLISKMFSFYIPSSKMMLVILNKFSTHPPFFIVKKKKKRKENNIKAFDSSWHYIFFDHHIFVGIRFA